MHIIVTTDLSGESASTCRVAAALARLTRGRLTVMHIVESLLDASTLDPEERAERLIEARTRLHAVCADLDTGGLGPRSLVARGFFDEVLAAHVERDPADLVIVGGASRRDRKHAVHLKRVLACPLMVLGTNPEALARAGETGRLRLLAAIDRTAASDAVTTWVKKLRACAPCDVTFLQAYWPASELARFGVPLGKDSFAESPAVARALESELAARVGHIVGDGETRFRCRPSAAIADDAILGTAREIAADLIIVGAHQRSAWQRLFYESVSDTVVRHGDLPIVCVGLFESGGDAGHATAGVHPMD